MTFPKYSDEEVLMREINEAELALADLHRAGLCACLVDPTESLADRIRHLGEIAVGAIALLPPRTFRFDRPDRSPSEEN